MKRWDKFFKQKEFIGARSSDGWRIVLFPFDNHGKETLLEVSNDIVPKNKLSWTVAFKENGDLDPQNFVPENPEMRLYDAQGVETAVLIGLTGRRCLLVSDPSHYLWPNSSGPRFYDIEERELARIVPTLVQGKAGCWSLIVVDPLTQRENMAAPKVAESQGAFVLCVEP